MHEYEVKVLEFLTKNRNTNFNALVKGTGLQTDQVHWALQQLRNKAVHGVEIEIKHNEKIIPTLTPEGAKYKTEFPEITLVKKIQESKSGIAAAKIKDKIALGWAKKNSWITLDNGIALLTKEGENIASGKKKYTIEILLKNLGESTENATEIINNNKEAIKTLVDRNLMELKKVDVPNLTTSVSSAYSTSTSLADYGIGDLNKEIIKNEDWKKKGFRKYDITAPTEVVYSARLHPIREFINVMRQHWLSMGFIEMHGPIIESAFWNFDVLFSPQDHPTREMQDTFFLSNPKQLSIEDIALMKRIKEMHLTGWKEDWSEEVARGAVLRTHTTSVSARHMKMLSKELKYDHPTKMFSVGPVFRNESIDYKHLAEMRQYDGIVVGDNLTLANLIHTMKNFYAKLGLDNVMMRPSYFPFTEPSIEFFYYDKERDSTIELCGGGIIRREITKAMGLNKTVLAWGGGVDRLLLNNDIFGVDSLPKLYKNEISWLRSRGNLKV